MDARVSGKVAKTLEPLHSMIYFAPEAEERYVKVGLKPGRMGYFASRSAAMGAVGGGVVAATFFNFNPSLVAHNIPRAWELASPADVLAARHDAVDAALRRMLGATAGSPEVAELAGLARTAAEAITVEGRPLAAAHKDLPWPEEPHLVLWHAVTLLREHRGDGHIAMLVAAELSGREALIAETATGRGFVPQVAQVSRGWSPDEWEAGVAGLRTRGILDAEGAMTEQGWTLKKQIEADTDRLGHEPWAALGAEATARVGDLGGRLRLALLEAGCFPKGVFAAGKR